MRLCALNHRPNYYCRHTMIPQKINILHEFCLKIHSHFHQHLVLPIHFHFIKSGNFEIEHMTMNEQWVRLNAAHVISFCHTKNFFAKFSMNIVLNQVYFTTILKFSSLIYHFHHFDAVFGWFSMKLKTKNSQRSTKMP